MTTTRITEADLAFNKRLMLQTPKRIQTNFPNNMWRFLSGGAYACTQGPIYLLEMRPII